MGLSASPNWIYRQSHYCTISHLSFVMKHHDFLQVFSICFHKDMKPHLLNTVFSTKMSQAQSFKCVWTLLCRHSAAWTALSPLIFKSAVTICAVKRCAPLMAFHKSLVNQGACHFDSVFFRLSVRKLTFPAFFCLSALCVENTASRSYGFGRSGCISVPKGAYRDYRRRAGGHWSHGRMNGFHTVTVNRTHCFSWQLFFKWDTSSVSWKLKVSQNYTSNYFSLSVFLSKTEHFWNSVHGRIS